MQGMEAKAPEGTVHQYGPSPLLWPHHGCRLHHSQGWAEESMQVHGACRLPLRVVHIFLLCKTPHRQVRGFQVDHLVSCQYLAKNPGHGWGEEPVHGGPQEMDDQQRYSPSLIECKAPTIQWAGRKFL